MAWFKLNESIKELRKANNMTQKELADKSGCSISAIRKYESGVLTPPLEKLYSIADALNQPVKQLDPTAGRAHSHFSVKLDILLKDNGVSLEELLTAVGYVPERFDGFRDLLLTPELVPDSFIIAVSKYFNVPVNYLYDSPEETFVFPEEKTFVLNDEEAKIINLYRSMNEEGRALFLDLIEALTNCPSMMLHQPAISAPDPGK